MITVNRSGCFCCCAGTSRKRSGLSSDGSRTDRAQCTRRVAGGTAQVDADRGTRPDVGSP